MYCLKLGLPINFWTHLTGFRHHSSTVSVWGLPPASRMSPFISRSSQDHSGPRRSVSIFLKRDLLLWNEHSHSFESATCFNYKSFTGSTTGLLTVSISKSSFVYAWLVPNFNIYCAKAQSPSLENFPQIDSHLVTWALHWLLNTVGSWHKCCPAWQGKSSCHRAGDDGVWRQPSPLCSSRPICIGSSTSCYAWTSRIVQIDWFLACN